MHGRTALTNRNPIGLAIVCLLAAVLSMAPDRCAHAQSASNPEEGSAAPTTPATTGGTPAPTTPTDPYEGQKQADPAFLVGIPVNFTGWLRRGSTQLQIGEYEGALDACRHALMFEKDNIVAHILLGDVLVKLHRYPEAETEFQYVMQRQPTEDSIVAKLGDLYMEQGNFVNAQNMFRKAISMQPKNPETWTNLARAYEGSNDLSSATDWYEKIEREFPNTVYAKVAQSRISQLGKAQEQARSDKFFPIDPDLGAEGFGWWDLKKMPISIYVDDGSDSRGFYQDMTQGVVKALQAWSNASRGAISFTIAPPDRFREGQWKAAERQARVTATLRSTGQVNMPNDPITAQIHIHWTDQLPGAVGLTWTSKLRDGNPTISKAHVWIATEKLANGQKMPAQQTPAMAPLFESQMQQIDEVSMHELGHALGLVHLTNPNDVMAPGLIGLRSGEPSSSRELSPRDIKALSEHYDYFRNAAASPHSVSQMAQETTDSRSPVAEPSFTANSELGGSKPEAPAAGEQEGGESPASGTTAGAGRQSLLAEARPASQRPTSYGSAGASSYDPLREVMFLINTKQYDKSLETLNRLLSRNTNNARARYLRACVYVYLRQYPMAVVDYKQVIKSSPGSELGKRAAEGLRRINQ